jgi:hypothetical protein
MGCVSVFGGFGIGIKTKSLEAILKLTSSRPGTSIIASSSSGTSDKGDESLPNKSGDTDRDTIDAEKLTGDSGGDEGGRGDEGVSTSTSKLLSRSLLSEGNVCRVDEEGAGSEIVLRGLINVGVATREYVGADFLVWRSVGFKGIGLLFHWPRSADIRKKVVRLPSYEKLNPKSSSSCVSSSSLSEEIPGLGPGALSLVISRSTSSDSSAASKLDVGGKSRSDPGYFEDAYA